VRVAPRRTQPVTSCPVSLYFRAYKTQLLVEELRVLALDPGLRRGDGFKAPAKLDTRHAEAQQPGAARRLQGVSATGRKMLLHFRHFRHPWRSDVAAQPTGMYSWRSQKATGCPRPAMIPESGCPSHHFSRPDNQCLLHFNRMLFNALLPFGRAGVVHRGAVDVDCDGYRHVLHFELVDRFHAEVGEGHHA